MMIFPSPITRRRRRPACQGLTLVELLLALSVTAIIALAISSMLFAVARGTSTNNDMRSLVLQQKIVGTRLDTALRRATKVLASGSGYLVVWLNDSRANGTPDLSELRRIEYDANTNTLRSYRMPETWTQTQIDANEVNYQISDDFNAMTNAVKGTSKFPLETWSNAVYGWTITLDNAVVQSAKLVSYRLTVQSGKQQAVVVGATALRN